MRTLEWDDTLLSVRPFVSREGYATVGLDSDPVTESLVPSVWRKSNPGPCLKCYPLLSLLMSRKRRSSLFHPSYLGTRTHLPPVRFLSKKKDTPTSSPGERKRRELEGRGRTRPGVIRVNRYSQPKTHPRTWPLRNRQLWQVCQVIPTFSHLPRYKSHFLPHEFQICMRERRWGDLRTDVLPFPNR